MPMKAAVFIDKDGTLIYDLPYNVDPERIELREGVAEALQTLRARNYDLVLVSNQSGVALGHFEERALNKVWERLRVLLNESGAELDAVYYCPHHPQGAVAPYSIACDCRKPAAGLLERAAADRGIDLEASWMVGDILDDIEAGRRAGCRTVLLDVGSETEWQRSPLRTPHHVARDFHEVVNHILEQRE